MKQPKSKLELLQFKAENRKPVTKKDLEKLNSIYDLYHKEYKENYDLDWWKNITDKLSKLKPLYLDDKGIIKFINDSESLGIRELYDCKLCYLNHLLAPGITKNEESFTKFIQSYIDSPILPKNEKESAKRKSEYKAIGDNSEFWKKVSEIEKLNN